MRELVLFIALSLVAAAVPLGLAPGALADGDDGGCTDPTDPDCQKDTAKQICSWTVNGAPASPTGIVVVPRGAALGPQTVVLDCPNHFLAHWDCSFKSMEAGPAGDTLPSEPECVHLGEQIVEDPCRTANTWEVAAPNLNTYTMSLQADVYKDADCDGEPDDWNSSGHDGSDEPVCRLNNDYGPKSDQGPPSPYTPVPDGQIDACDLQHYEVQWRQWN